MTRKLDWICAGISGLFCLGMVLYFGLGSGRVWLFAAISSVALLGIQLATWALCKEKNFIIYALSFIPACLLVPAFLSGRIAFSPWFWACLIAFAGVLVISRLKWADARSYTLCWLGIPCYLVIFLALAGYLYSL